MSSAQSYVHRMYLKICQGRASWHQRFYRPSVRVVRSGDRVYFAEGGQILEARTVASFSGSFSGRANVVLSGPSVRSIENFTRVTENPLVGVNGSPALLPDDTSFFLYHVNDTGYIRNNPGKFLEYATRAEWTLIDFRAVYLLLKMQVDLPKSVNFVVFDNWGWPLSNAVGEIPSIANQPQKGEAYLSLDPSLGLANAGTVAFTASQALWHWGFDRIYFYGLDLNAKGRAYNESKPQPQRLDKVYERIIEPAFALLSEHAAYSGTQLYNCSLESRLPDTIIPKLDPEVSFDHLALES